MKGLVIYMDFQTIENALLSVMDNVYHYEALGAKAPYIVWAEDSETTNVSADNKKVFQTIQGTIDYYTYTGNDENLSKIQQALNDAEISFSLNTIEYEDETTLTHYEWIFEAIPWPAL